jgi:PIN domain nuclease of toxin-antitoxin system
MTGGYLLDTSVLLRYLDDPASLPDEVQEILADPGVRVVASAASFFEIAVKKALKKARVPDSLPDAVAAAGLEVLDLSAEHTWKTLRLPYHHTDPYDRLILAQAAINGLTIITATPYFDAYGFPVIKA